MKAEARYGCLDFDQCGGCGNRKVPAATGVQRPFFESTMFLHSDCCSSLRHLASSATMADGLLRFGVVAQPNKHGPPILFR